ncbi:putative transcriptional regulator, TetR family protein [Leifsonia sp. LS1]|nr:putative transcriptional regulator, TetR family protein [Leifsonia sp. LS1]
MALTALRILDDHGLPDLTMRRLAAALDVQPSALYWHFPNKQTLLADLADRIVAASEAGASGRAAAPEPTGMDAVRDEAAALRDALLAYRDGAEVVASTLALGLGAGAALDRLASAVARGGFDDATCRRAATALLHFVLGHVSHEQQRMQYDSLGVLTDAAEPAITPGGDSATAEFSFGVDLLVGGLEHLRAQQRDAEVSRPRT